MSRATYIPDHVKKELNGKREEESPGRDGEGEGAHRDIKSDDE